jgi:hypothetical protein
MTTRWSGGPELLADLALSCALWLGGDGAGSADPGYRPDLQADITQSGLNRRAGSRGPPRRQRDFTLHNDCHDDHTACCRGDHSTGG